MSREKQVERISHELNMSGKSLDTIIPEECDKIAAILYDAGCRMQSEGEWETIPDYQPNKLAAYHHICSECKTFYKDIRPHGHKYCPECGAKMKGGEE